jgi:hypothetical protein
MANVIHRAAFWTLIPVSLSVDYRRDLGGFIGAEMIAALPAAPAAPALRQLATDGVPFGVDGRHARPHRHLIRPVVRVETLGALHQLVALFRAARSPGDALQQIVVAAPEAAGLLSAERASEQRLIVDHHRRGRRHGRTRGRGLMARFARRPWGLRLVPWGMSHFAAERMPVEPKVWMRMLQSFP